MTTAGQVRNWHKWLGLVLGVQMLIWCVSGLYMVSFDIDFIRGLPLVRVYEPDVSTEPLIPIGPLLRKHPGVTGLKLTSLPDSTRPVYQLRLSEKTLLVDAVSGETLSPLPPARIERLARSYYAGRGQLERATMIDDMPVEIRGRTPPVWRVDFDDELSTSFYLDPDTGALSTRRHKWWRVFDAFWMLHIMDYGYERDDMNNLLLRLVSAGGVAFGITGVWLLFYSFRRRARS